MRKRYFCLLCLALSLCPRPPPLLPQHITTPDTAKLIKMATFFHNRWRKPQCIGATDGSLIPIVASPGLLKQEKVALDRITRSCVWERPVLGCVCGLCRECV